VFLAKINNVNLLDHFEKIYLITSYHTKDRLKDTLPHLKENGIDPELFVAPIKYHFPHYHKYNTEQIWPGKLSVACAYEQLFQKCLIENTETALFIEDDITLLNNWENIIKAKWFSQKNWYMLKDGVQCHFFGMSNRAMRDFLNKYALNNYHIDFAFNDLDKNISTSHFTRQRSVEKQVPSAIDTEEDKYDLQF